jgi:hypothetical protein
VNQVAAPKKEEHIMRIVSFARSRGRLLMLFAVMLAAASLSYAIGVATAADPRLDEADLALQKAQALLEASQTGGGVSDQAQHRFDKAVARAILDVEDARAEIVDAKAAVDTP